MCIRDRVSAVPAESREPSESLLTRCAPKLSTGASSEGWTTSKAARKKTKKKAAKARKAEESRKEESP